MVHHQPILLARIVRLVTVCNAANRLECADLYRIADLKTLVTVSDGLPDSQVQQRESVVKNLVHVK